MAVKLAEQADEIAARMLEIQREEGRSPAEDAKAAEGDVPVPRKALKMGGCELWLDGQKIGFSPEAVLRVEDARKRLLWDWAAPAAVAPIPRPETAAAAFDRVWSRHSGISLGSGVPHGFLSELRAALIDLDARRAREAPLAFDPATLKVGDRVGGWFIQGVERIHSVEWCGIKELRVRFAAPPADGGSRG